jgi:plastocyanin
MKIKIALALFTCSSLLLFNCSSDDSENPPVEVNYTLQVSAGEGGIVDNTGGTFTEGEEVTITATAAADYVFSNWSNGSEENPLTLTMNDDIEITANFSSVISSNTFEISVTASSARDYTLSGTDRNGSVSGEDPSLTFHIGDEIKFNVSTPGHPFLLKTVSGTGDDNLIPNIANLGTTGGTVTWTPTEAGTYFYQCRPHVDMVGTITIE